MKTISRAYDTFATADRTVKELEAAGIASKDISLVANKHVGAAYENVETVGGAATGATIGAAIGGGAGLLAGLGMLAIPGLGPVVAAGWLAATAVGAGGGAAAGGLVGALVDTGVSEDDAHVYSEAVRRGATVLTVRVNEDDEPRVQSILDAHESIDVTTRRAEYESAGWKQFDPAAPACRPTADEIDRTRRQ
jgi:hypothetical protein